MARSSCRCAQRRVVLRHQQVLPVVGKLHPGARDFDARSGARVLLVLGLGLRRPAERVTLASAVSTSASAFTAARYAAPPARPPAPGRLSTSDLAADTARFRGLEPANGSEIENALRCRSDAHPWC